MRVPLFVWIFLAMALGVAVGLPLAFLAEAGVIDRSVALGVAGVGHELGSLFLALLKMVVVPLVFCSVATTVCRVGRGAELGRLGGLTVAYYITTSAIAIGIGLAVVNLIRPGAGLDFAALLASARGELDVTGAALPPGLEGLDPTAVPALTEGGGLWGIPWSDLAAIVHRAIPTNVVGAASDNNAILAVIVFAALVGLFTARTGGDAADLLGRVYEAGYQVMLKLTSAILVLAPVGVFGFLLYVTAGTGLALAGSLGWYMVTVLLGLALHAVVVLPLALVLFARRSPVVYLGAMWEALAMAFSTASSSGTLPVTLRCATERGGVRERVASFTLPLGATVNMDGTALYEVVAVLFVAQMLGEPTLAQQVVLAVTALVASIGAAGIPHAGTVMLVVVMGAVGVPTEAVLVLFAVDRVLDMARTTVNVWSDAVGAAIVDRLASEEATIGTAVEGGSD